MFQSKPFAGEIFIENQIHWFQKEDTEDEDVTGGFQCLVHQQQNKTKIVYRKDKRGATLTNRQRMHSFAAMLCI